LVNGRKQCVRRRCVGGGLSRCAMTGQSALMGELERNLERCHP
jgi:hypothetical protein